MKINKYSVLIFMFSISILIGQYLKYVSKIGSLFIILFSLCYIGKKGKLNKGLYSNHIFGLIFILIIGIVISYIYFKQSIVRCCVILLPLFTSLFFYNVLVDLVKIGKIQSKDIKKIIVSLSIICVFLFSYQYFLGEDHIIFLVHVGHRNNRVRFYFQNIGIVLGVCLLFSDYIETKHLRMSTSNKILLYKICSIAFIIFSLFEIAYMQNYRLATLGLLASMFSVYIISRKSWKKLFLIAISIPLIIVIFANNAELQSMYNSFINGTGSFTTRKMAIPFYFKQLNNHWIFGNGYVVNDYPYNYAALAAGYSKNILLNDNGIFGFLYMYGISGIVWFVCTWWKMFSVAIFLLKKQKKFGSLIFLFYTLFTLRNEIHWFWNYGMIVLVLFFVYLDAEISEYKKGKKQYYVQINGLYR